MPLTWRVIIGVQERHSIALPLERKVALSYGFLFAPCARSKDVATWYIAQCEGADDAATR